MQLAERQPKHKIILHPIAVIFDFLFLRPSHALDTKLLSPHLRRDIGLADFRD